VNVAEVAERIEGKLVAGAADAPNREVSGGYASDLLSDVITNGREGDLWVTVQKHVNTVAVARLNGLAGIVLVNGREPDPQMLARAEREHIPVVSTPLPAFEVAGVVFGLGIRGRRLV
jgi:hypothetical protein